MAQVAGAAARVELKVATVTSCTTSSGSFSPPLLAPHRAWELLAKKSRHSAIMRTCSAMQCNSMCRRSALNKVASPGTKTGQFPMIRKGLNCGVHKSGGRHGSKKWSIEREPGGSEKSLGRFTKLVWSVPSGGRVNPPANERGDPAGTHT